MSIRNYFSIPLYICVYTDKITIRALDGSDRFLEGEPGTPFTTQRLLIGNFKSAEKTLSEGVDGLRGGGVVKKSFRAVIHPVDMSEDGLCEVEERVLRELVCSAGAHHHVIHTGSILSPNEALDLLDS